MRGMCALDSYNFIGSYRDTYDIYANPALSPTIQADPAPLSESSILTLANNEPDVTVGDICKFIVKYIKSDVLVCFLLSVYTHLETHMFWAKQRVC